jgi:hypothetical protein
LFGDLANLTDLEAAALGVTIVRTHIINSGQSPPSREPPAEAVPARPAPRAMLGPSASVNHWALLCDSANMPKTWLSYVMRMAFVMSREPLRLAPPLSQRKKLSSDPIHQKAAHIRTTALRVTNRAIAGQLKDLADEYQRRAEKASYVDAAKASAVGAEGTALVTSGCQAPRRGHRLLFPRPRLHSFKSRSGKPTCNDDCHGKVISFSNFGLERMWVKLFGLSKNLSASEHG